MTDAADPSTEVPTVGTAGSAEPAQAPPLARGTLVDRYVVLDVIGRGGMGVVYAAYDSQLDRKLAIKFLHTGQGDDDTFSEGKARLVREAQAMARLSHPNVVAIHDVGTHGDSVFIAMELIDGVTMSTWLSTKRTWKQCVRVLLEAGRGLAAAHAAGLIHRDFKPENILIGKDGRVTVTDFGVARDKSDVAHVRRKSKPSLPPSSDGAPSLVVPPTDASLARSITLTGSLLGTIGYMAPEQAWEEAVAARSDQFSFCATAYFALYGERPYLGNDIASYLDALADAPREPQNPGDVPRWLHQIVLKGLRQKAEDRYASMEQLLLALGKNPKASRLRAMVAVALAVLLGVGIVAVRAQRQRLYEVCDGGRSELFGAWDDTVKQRVHTAFLATRRPDAEETFRRVSDRLEEHAQSWARMHAEACVATRIQHQQPEDVLALRMGCLERERIEIKSLTALLSHADDAVLPRALEATYGLTSPRWCADVNGLRSAIGLPDNAELRAKVLAVRAQIADADSLRAAGKSREARALAERALADARATPFPAVTFEALSLVALTSEYSGDYAAAVPSYKEAAWSALRAKSDATVARAAARLAFILGDKLFKLDEAEDWWELAQGSLVRLGDNEAVESDILGARAVLLVAEGRPDESLPLHARVIQIRTKSLGLEHPQTATAINNLGYGYQILGRFDLALNEHERSYAIQLRTLGEGHPQIVIDLANLGSTNLGLGNYDKAETYLTKAVALAESHGPANFWTAWALQYLSLTETLRGNPGKGLELGTRGLAVLERVGGMELRTAPGFLVNVARAHAALGHAREALELCERALPLQERGALLPERVYEWDALRCIGDARIALGRPSEALPPLERSVKFERRVYAGDAARVRFSLARALVDAKDARDVKSDFKRAVTLAKQARAELASIAGASAEVVAIDRWLATQRP